MERSGADREGQDRYRRPGTALDGRPSDHDRPIRNASRTLFVFGSILLVTGTIVTGSGPHSGSDDELVADRLPFLVRDVTRIHSITAFTVLAVVLVIIRRAHRPRSSRCVSKRCGS